MKTTSKCNLYIIVMLSISIEIFASETIRISAEEWLPFSSANLKYNGLMCRIITEAFALENVSVEYGFFPGARALLLVKNGEWDAVGGWTPTEERSKDHYFSDTLLDETMVFFHLKKTTFDWKALDDLVGKRIGATIDYYYGKAFEDAEKEGKLLVEYVHSDELNFRKLVAGRIDIFPANLDAGLSLLHEKFKLEEVDAITYHRLPLDQGPLVLMFSKKVEKNRRLLVLFNKGLKRLRSTGQYDLFFEESRQGKYRN